MLLLDSKFPSEAWIFANRITITRKRICLDEDGQTLNGLFDAEKNRIEISSNQTLDKQWQTLFHELHHVCLQYTGESSRNSDDIYVELVAQAAFQLAMTLK